ncbi:MAG: hypothetical protein ACK559_32465 [bacterium]
MAGAQTGQCRVAARLVGDVLQTAGSRMLGVGGGSRGGRSGGSVTSAARFRSAAFCGSLSFVSGAENRLSGRLLSGGGDGIRIRVHLISVRRKTQLLFF